MNELLQTSVPLPVFIAFVIATLVLAFTVLRVNSNWDKKAKEINASWKKLAVEQNIEWSELCAKRDNKAYEEAVSKGFAAGVEYANSQKSGYPEDGLLNLEK